MKTSPVLKATLEMQESINKISTLLEKQATSQVTQQPVTTPQPIVNNTLGINWTPIVQG